MSKKVIVKVLDTEYVTHDVKRFVLEKPPGFDFTPGQSVDVSINLPEWTKEVRPFTFTNLPDDDYLELMIKIYQSQHKVTHKLDSINSNGELILHDVFGTIQYESRGTFIAAGSGITPFLSILRYLNKTDQIQGNTLIYSNKTAEDVIMEDELHKMLGDNFIKIFTRENVVGFLDKRIDREFLISTIPDFNQSFYVCGPDSFVKNMNVLLLNLGAKSEFIIFQE